MDNNLVLLKMSLDNLDKKVVLIISGVLDGKGIKITFRGKMDTLTGGGRYLIKDIREHSAHNVITFGIEDVQSIVRGNTINLKG